MAGKAMEKSKGKGKGKKVLVTGARGPVGWNVLQHFAAQPGWEAVGVARNRPVIETFLPFVNIDLLDWQATCKAFEAFKDVTHLVYSAVLDRPQVARGWTEAEHISTNLAMLRNTIEALEQVGAPLEHVGLLQGTKAYGVHLGGVIKVPARESDAIHMPPNFYFAQQEYLWDKQKGKPWSWTIYRPQIVGGICPGAPSNMISSFGVYSVISRELGLPLRFPGPAYAGLVEFVDARLLARAIYWGAISPAAANQAFNVTNGDVLDWHNLFQKLARFFGMELDRPQPMSLTVMMEDKAPVWDAIVRKHDLFPLSYDAVKGNWQMVDFACAMGLAEPPPILSTIKIRQAGFHDCRDTEDMFIDYLREMQQLRYLPH